MNLSLLIILTSKHVIVTNALKILSDISICNVDLMLSTSWVFDTCPFGINVKLKNDFHNPN